MPAKDIYHDQVKNALEKENWQITKDPLVLKWGTRDLYIDLGAE
ncbi:MAG: element excision factor XisH family protein, partial [Aphanizomenon sp.]